MDTYYVCILLLLLSYHCLKIYVYITCVYIYIYADIRVCVSECAHGQSVYTFFVGNRWLSLQVHWHIPMFSIPWCVPSLFQGLSPSFSHTEWPWKGHEGPDEITCGAKVCCWFFGIWSLSLWSWQMPLKTPRTSWCWSVIAPCGIGLWTSSTISSLAMTQVLGLRWFSDATAESRTQDWERCLNGTPLTWVTSRWDIHSTKSVCPCQMLQGLQGESLWDAVCKLDFGWVWMDHKAWAKFRFRGEDSNPIHEKWGVLRKLPATISEHGCCLTQLWWHGCREFTRPMWRIRSLREYESRVNMFMCDCSRLIILGAVFGSEKKCKTALEMSDISLSDACRIAWFSSCLRFHHKSGGTPILGKPYFFLLMVIGLLYTIRIYCILVSNRSHCFDPRFSLRWSLSSWRSSQPQTLRMPPGQGVTRHCGQLLDIAGIIWYLWTCQEFSRFFC